MAFTPLDGKSCQPDDWAIGWDKLPATDAEKDNAMKKCDKGWNAIKQDLNGVADLTFMKPDFHKLIDDVAAANNKAIIFELKLSKTELRLDAEAGNTTVKVGTEKVPTDREDYRDFLKKLNDFSSGDRSIISNADYKGFNEDFPKKPSWKTFDELSRGGTKDDMAAFHTWAKSKPKAKAPLAAFDAAKKPADKSTAAKAVDPFYQDWLKTAF